MSKPLELFEPDELARLVEEHGILMETIQESPVHFCVYDAEGYLLAWNKAYEGNYPNAFVDLYDLVEARRVKYADLLRCQLSRTLTPSEVEAEVDRRVEMQNNADGTPVIRAYPNHTLRVHKYPLPSGAVAGLALDISDLVEHEKELSLARLEAERGERSKAAFLANMSHEIRTPMNGIIGLASMLDETELTDDQRDMLRTIIGSADSLLETINEILDFSKIEAGKLEIHVEPFDLRRMILEIHDLLAPVANKKNLKLKIHYPAHDQTYYLGDPLRIRQCLVNLIGNALKFTLSGGVTVTVDRKSDGHISMAVADTGIGIAADNLDKIFSVFEQEDATTARRFEGSGLGLAITRRLAEVMGGSIKVESELGKGSTFTIALPLELSKPPEAVEGGGNDARAAMTDFSNLRILLAEDNRTNRMVFERMMEKTGAQISIAKDGREAVDQFIQDHPDVIFMDVSMPVMSGLDATKEIRRIEAQTGSDPVRIVALTANAMAEHVAQCRDAGMNDFLSKPMRKADLWQCLAWQV